MPGIILVWTLVLTLSLQGCFSIPDPAGDRDERVLEALAIDEARPVPPSPLRPESAVSYALCHNLDIKVAEIEAAYQNESLVASRRRLLPSLTARYSVEHSSHPNARWSMSSASGSQSLESSYSSEPTSHRSDVGAMWSVLDFGVGYLKSRQQDERVRGAEEQRRRVRQQIVLDVLTHYWRATVAEAISRKAELLRSELEEQAAAIRDSVDMRILSQAEGARRELSVHSGLAELEQWRRLAVQARLELARIMGAGSAVDFELAEFPSELPEPPAIPGGDPEALQSAALRRRPELFQQDAQERIAVEEAKLAILQMAPNANLSLNLYHDPDKFLEWNNWMTVGARVSWNLFNIPARLSERRMAHLQKDLAHNRGLALAAGIMAQVGIAYSDWQLSRQYAEKLYERAATRRRLVEALAAGEKDGQTRPGEVLMERVRLLGETAMAMRAGAEVRVAGARLANAVGLDVDADGRIRWDIEADGRCDESIVDATLIVESDTDTNINKVTETSTDTVTDTDTDTASATEDDAESIFDDDADANANVDANSLDGTFHPIEWDDEDDAYETSSVDASEQWVRFNPDGTTDVLAGDPFAKSSGTMASGPADKNGSGSRAGLRVVRAEDFVSPDEIFEPKGDAVPEAVRVMAPAKPPQSEKNPVTGLHRFPMTAVDLRNVLNERKPVTPPAIPPAAPSLRPPATPPKTEGPDDRSDRERALELLPDLTATSGTSGNKGK